MAREEGVGQDPLGPDGSQGLGPAPQGLPQSRLAGDNNMESGGKLEHARESGEIWGPVERVAPQPSYLEPTAAPPIPGGVENPSARLPHGGHPALAGTALSILLPALNEERGVVEVMNRIPHQVLTRSGLLPRIYLLDGRSTDRTRLFAERLGAKVVVQKGVGKGSAFREFIPGIQEELIIFLDSDGTYPPEIIPRFVEKLREGNPVVLGSRLTGTMDVGAMSMLNYLGNRALSWIASVLFRIPISDVCSGMWAFSARHLKSLDLAAEGFELEAELFAECALKGIPIVEIPIPYGKRLGETKLRARTALQIAFTLFKKRVRPYNANGVSFPSLRPIPPIEREGQGS